MEHYRREYGKSSDTDEEVLNIIKNLSIHRDSSKQKSYLINKATLTIFNILDLMLTAIIQFLVFTVDVIMFLDTVLNVQLIAY